MIDLTKIPKDWPIKRIGKITKTLAGGTPSTIKREYWGGDIKWMSSGELNMKLVYEVEGRITELGLKSSSTRLIPPKCILIGLAGQGKTRGTVAMNMIELCTNQSIAAILPSDDFFEDYLYHNLDFRYDELRQLSTGEGGRGGLNLNIINSIQIPLPPLPEQKAIAQVLSTADAAIHTTEKLIAQKELCKKWLMQQLITGKKRLKGFDGEWKELRLKDVTNKFSRRNKNLVDAKVYSVTNKSGFVLQSVHFEGKVAGEDLSNYKIIKKKEFAYNPARVNVGSLAYFEEEIGVISSLYVCFKTTKDILDYFLLQFLQIDHTKHRIEALGEGGVRVYLWYDLFSKIKIKIPSIEEQTVISQVLQAADKEINLLKAKAEKLKEQKKGLMQQLLTGKVRLNINHLK
jgi:type I restriction enzyme S subunit